MSALDQAFSKLYDATQRDAPSLGHSIEEAPLELNPQLAPAESHLVYAPTVTSSEAPAFDASPATPLATPLTEEALLWSTSTDEVHLQRIDSPAENAPSPHFQIAEEELPRREEASQKHVAEQALPADTNDAARTNQPTDASRAAWEVDELLWPRIVDQLTRGPAAAAFHETGRQLAEASRNGLRLMAVTSAYRGEGRTTVAQWLTRSAAAAGLRVALVDIDTANPQLGRTMGAELSTSWRNCQADDLAAAAVESLADGVTLFPLGAPSDSEEETPHAARQQAERSAALAQNFDLVIFDAPPVEQGLNDLLQMKTQAAIVVRDVRRTPEAAAHAAALRVQQAGVASVGLIENSQQIGRGGEREVLSPAVA